MLHVRNRGHSRAPVRFYNSSGYEPKHGTVYSTTNYLKVKDSMIHVLPEWDYGAGRIRIQAV